MTEPAFDQLLRRLSAAEIGSGERVAIETALGLLDVVQGLDGVPPYDELRKSAVEAEILGVEIDPLSNLTSPTTRFRRFHG